MTYLNFNLQESGMITHCITGTFTGENEIEIIIIRSQQTIELYSIQTTLSETLQFQLLFQQQLFCIVRNIQKISIDQIVIEPIVFDQIDICLIYVDSVNFCDNFMLTHVEFFEYIEYNVFCL